MGKKNYKTIDKNDIAIFDDISDQIKMQESLIESEEKFRGLFKALNTGVVICHMLRKKSRKPELLVERVNQAFEKITGISGKQIASKNLDDVLNKNHIHIQEWLNSNTTKKLRDTDFFWKEKQKHLHFTTFTIQQKQSVLIVQDVTKEKNEMISRSHLASIVEFSEDAIYSVSLDGTIISWNKGAENFYGYKHDEVVGKNINILSGNNRNENIHEQLIERVKKGKVVKNKELMQQNKQGEEIPVSLTKSPILNEKGEIIAISDVVKDMTRIKERENNLVKAKQKSEEAALLKTTFLQNVSHEIRTPMNSIIGYTDILKKRIGGKDKKYMEAIEQSGHQLLRLIDDILDLSRLESGELSVSKSSFKLDELLHSLQDSFNGYKKTKNKSELKLNLTIPPSENPVYLNTDRDRLQQILINLLSNAIKYTEKGLVEFGYKISKKSILFFVKDTGKGIPEQYLEKIFERFERGGIDSEDIFSGTGLGLSISKGLANILGGKIWCESKVGEGSNFYFTVPNDSVKQPEESGPENNIQEEEIPNLKGKTILIAEDDEFSFQMMKIMLEPTQATIHHAPDGEKAINLFLKEKTDLALLDIRLPRKNGFEIVNEIRKTNKEIPLIAQSAYAMPDDKKKILENGFSAYLEKPLISAKLYRMLHQYLLDGKNL